MMDIFISWSGELSHKAACVFREWLPSVLQYVRPYVSSEDIDKGARWSSDIAGKLDASNYGIICLTRENLNAPWITFEAGALSKTLDKSLVSPVLIDIKRSEVAGPLIQFQSSLPKRDEILKLVKSINKNSPDDVARLSDERLMIAFEKFWDEFDDSLRTICDVSNNPVPSNDEASKVDQLLEEIVELGRLNLKILSSPGRLLPPEYIKDVFSHIESLQAHPKLSGPNRVESFKVYRAADRYLRAMFHSLKCILDTDSRTISQKEAERFVNRMANITRNMEKLGILLGARDS